MSNNCLFCGIVNGTVPARKIYEDDDVLAFLDISGDIYGHTLVVPKQHYENALVCPPDMLKKVIETVQKISRHYTENLGFDGINILANCGESAEQSIMHLHFHIIPRTMSQAPKTIYASLEKNNFNFDQMQEKLKMN